MTANLYPNLFFVSLVGDTFTGNLVGCQIKGRVPDCDVKASAAIRVLMMPKLCRRACPLALNCGC